MVASEDLGTTEISCPKKYEDIELHKIVIQGFFGNLRGEKRRIASLRWDFASQKHETIGRMRRIGGFDAIADREDLR